MLAAWRLACPTKAGDRERVFPALGASDAAQHKKRGGPLSYTNFRNTYWRPALVGLGLPYVTPHSARHAFISTLQSKGIEVGLVAMLAGHANATVTLTHYTQAVRGGEAAVQARRRPIPGAQRAATRTDGRNDPLPALQSDEGNVAGATSPQANTSRSRRRD